MEQEKEDITPSNLITELCEKPDPTTSKYEEAKPLVNKRNNKEEIIEISNTELKVVEEFIEDVHET